MLGRRIKLMSFLCVPNSFFNFREDKIPLLNTNLPSVYLQLCLPSDGTGEETQKPVKSFMVIFFQILGILLFVDAWMTHQAHEHFCVFQIHLYPLHPEQHKRFDFVS